MGIGGGNRVEGNFIGVNKDGITDRGNSDGVFVDGASNTPNTVGGTEPEMRNVISGNDGNGVFFGGTGSSETKVQGNYIGTTADGTADLGNLFSGVSVTGDSNTIGGTEAGARNVISGNGENGVFVRDSGATNNEVKGNYVGTTVAGTEPLANGMHGVSILGASDNTVGGTALGAGNVISGNGFHGVSITGSVSGATGNTIEGNYIGTDADGSGDLGNGLHGISIYEADSNAVGGTLAGAANRIAHNGGDGVSIDGLFVDPIGNSILSNRIFDNDGLGIDLNDDGVTPNDTGDTDAGPNNFQNFPLILSARKPTTSRITTISGRLNSNPSQEFAVQCFLTNGAPASAYGEGWRLLDTAVASTDATGIARFSCESRLLPGQTVSATATDVLTGDISEFSKNKTITTVP